MSLKYEQPGSARDMLTRAGAKHGDTVEVTMAVGVPETGRWSALAAFCCSEAVCGDVLQSGTPEEHNQPISGNPIFRNRRKLAKKLRCRPPGVAVLKGTVHTNGDIVFNLDPESLLYFPLTAGDPHLLRSWSGRYLAEKALAEVSTGS